MTGDDPGCVKTLRGITAPEILGSVAMRRATKRKNLSSAPRYDEIRFRFHTTKTHSGHKLGRNPALQQSPGIGMMCYPSGRKRGHGAGGGALMLGTGCRAFFALFGGMALILATAATAAAQPSFPTRPIRLIVPYPAGGGTDIVARVIGQRLQERLGQPNVIDNAGRA